jgi:tetratricopeptide (TPR) repeat protein
VKVNALYTSEEACRLASVPPTLLRSLRRARHVVPERGRNRHARYAFQDLVLLRMAHALKEAHVPARRLHRVLRTLRERLPGSLPLSGLSLDALSGRIVVREGGLQWEGETGQLLLTLEMAGGGAEVRVMKRGSARTRSASEEYETGCRLEESDVAEALAAYRRCLARNHGHLEARINCGRLLHLAGELAQAERLYRESEVMNATLLFNLAVLLEDLDREEEAVKTYRHAIDLDGALADAHFNLARLHEKAGRRRDAIRHLTAYRRLTAL